MISPPRYITGDTRTKSTRRTVDSEFRLEATRLIVNQSYAIRAACDVMDISKSSLKNWSCKLHTERKGNESTETPLTPEQRRIRKLKKQLIRIDEENTILKNVSAFVDSLNTSR